MDDQSFMQSHCRPDSNWFVIAYPDGATWVFSIPRTARAIRAYVQMDQGKWF